MEPTIKTTIIRIYELEISKKFSLTDGLCFITGPSLRRILFDYIKVCKNIGQPEGILLFDIIHWDKKIAIQRMSPITDVDVSKIIEQIEFHFDLLGKK